jgi:glyoxylase-like metal-dependent hydrolase (beta-lactamase superfamily II)
LPNLDDVEIVLPDLIFESGMLSIHLGGKTLRLQHLPGHSLDLIGVLVTNDRILFASDNAMPVPTIFDGSYEALVNSLHRMLAMAPDSVVQGHGEVILRGEVEATIQADLDYLQAIKSAVESVIAKGQPAKALQEVTIESCGKSRIPLNGLVTDLHQANLLKLYEELTGVRV